MLYPTSRTLRLSGFSCLPVLGVAEKQESCKTRRENQLLLILGFVIAPGMVDGYFIWKVGLYRFLFCTVFFGLKYYATYGDVNTFWGALTDSIVPLGLATFPT